MGLRDLIAITKRRVAVQRNHRASHESLQFLRRNFLIDHLARAGISFSTVMGSLLSHVIEVPLFVSLTSTRMYVSSTCSVLITCKVTTIVLAPRLKETQIPGE
jgi:hypothetical protein